MFVEVHQPKEAVYTFRDIFLFPLMRYYRFSITPTQMTFAPVLRLYSKLSMLGIFVGRWLVHTGYGLPFAIFMLHSFFDSLPSELFEAAHIDGASLRTTFGRLALLLSVPAPASLVIFQFLFVWNDLLVALIYLGGHESVAPLTVRVSDLVGSYGQDWHLLTTAAFVSMLAPCSCFSRCRSILYEVYWAER